VRRNFDLEDVHVWGAERIAEAVAKYDVDRYVHVSSYNADKNSPSEFYRTKGLGEEVARSIFPETTIVRPAPLFGFEDQLLNTLAGVTNLFTSNWMQQRFSPVHAIDVGMALEAMMHDDNTASQTFELYGPTNYSMAEIAEIVDKEIVKHRRHINIPKQIRKPFANIMNKALWWPVGSADEVEREFIDQYVDPSAKTFADLDIDPVELSAVTYEYLVSRNCVIQHYQQQTNILSFLTEARLTTIYHHRLSVKSVRRRSMCMSLTTNKFRNFICSVYSFLGGHGEAAVCAMPYVHSYQLSSSQNLRVKTRGTKLVINCRRH
jgi:uncharacterized protein YbjT (DUF2867 family)